MLALYSREHPPPKKKNQNIILGGKGQYRKVNVRHAGKVFF